MLTHSWIHFCMASALALCLGGAAVVHGADKSTTIPSAEYIGTVKFHGKTALAVRLKLAKDGLAKRFTGTVEDSELGKMRVRPTDKPDTDFVFGICGEMGRGGAVPCTMGNDLPNRFMIWIETGCPLRIGRRPDPERSDEQDLGSQLRIVVEMKRVPAKDAAGN